MLVQDASLPFLVLHDCIFPSHAFHSLNLTYQSLSKVFLKLCDLDSAIYYKISCQNFPKYEVTIYYNNLNPKG